MRTQRKQERRDVQWISIGCLPATRDDCNMSALDVSR